MLTPLLTWQEYDGVSGKEYPVMVGRGQLFGICGSDWQAVFARGLDAARASGTPFRIVDAAPDPDAAIHPKNPLLWFVRDGSAVASATLEPLLSAAELLGQRGGGAVFGAEFLPRDKFSACLNTSPETGPVGTAFTLLDDSSRPVNFLRQGEWGGLRFLLADFVMSDYQTVQLRITGPGVNWISEPCLLDAWQILSPRPAAIHAELSAAFPPGRYRADVIFSKNSTGTGLRPGRKERKNKGQKPQATAGNPPDLPGSGVFFIRPSLCHQPVEHRQVHWRFTGAPGVPRRIAAMTLRLPPRDRLMLGGEHEENLLSGWDGPEPAGPGAFSRWIRQKAICALGGRGRTLQLDLRDLRPRINGPDPTTLTARLDEGNARVWTWHHPGGQLLEMPWPDDPFTHRLTLEVFPDWSPAEYGNLDDQRRLGLQVYGIRILHEH